MQRDFIRIDYCIKFKTPFHFGTGLRRDLLDRSVCRDAEGYLYIPGSTLKGVFRERCEQIANLVGLSTISPHDEQEAIVEFRDDIGIINSIFGSRYRPGEIYFDNVTMVPNDQRFFDSGETAKHYIQMQTETRTQTSISRVLGTAREQTLFQSEFGIRDLCFEGQIYGYLEGFRVLENEWNYPLLLLVVGILINDRIGGNKSTGMGKYTCQIQTVNINDTSIEVSDILVTLSELGSCHGGREDTV